MPTTFASLTAPLVTLATNLIGDLGLAGVFLLILSSAVIHAPGTEATMLFAGFEVYAGHLALPGVIVAGVLGDVIGAAIGFAIGAWGGHELWDRPGARLRLSPRSRARAQRWFARYGTAAILISRVLPIVRAAFPYAAGAAKVGFGRFVALTTVGSVVWITGLALLGEAVGSQWQAWRHHLEYVDYAAGVLVAAAVVYLILRRRAGRRAAAVGA